MRAIMVQNGDSDKLIWATEYGFQTVLDQLGVVDPTSNQLQADFIQDFITTWRALTYTGPLFIYTTRDGVPGTDTGYGIFQADWTAKLAVKVISDAIGLPPVIVSPIVALAELIQKAVAQFQKAFASFTTSLQTAFANAVKAFQSLLSGIFKPAAAQPTTTASLAPAARVDQFGHSLGGQPGRDGTEVSGGRREGHCRACEGRRQVGIGRRQGR